MRGCGSELGLGGSAAPKPDAPLPVLTLTAFLRHPKVPRHAGVPRGAALLSSRDAGLLEPPERPQGSLQDLGRFSLSLKRTLRQRVRSGRPGRTHLGSAALRSLRCGVLGIFFFFLCIIHSVPSLLSLSCPPPPAPFPLRCQNSTYPRVLSAGF